jgi:hypothetical protein
MNTHSTKISNIKSLAFMPAIKRCLNLFYFTQMLCQALAKRMLTGVSVYGA